MKKFDQMRSNLHHLKNSVALLQESKNGEQLYLQETGLIGQFNLQFDLSWKTLKKLIETEEKNPAAKTGSPRGILKEAFFTYGFLDEIVWIKMLEARNEMTHVDDDEPLEEMVIAVILDYLPAFEKLENDLLCYYGSRLDEIL